jgi:MFS family permease
MAIFSFIYHNGRYLLGGFLMFFLSSFGQTFFVALSAADIRREFGLSHGDLGLINTVTTLASAFTLTWFGYLVDRYPMRRLLWWVMGGLATACLILAYSQNIVVLMLALYCLRLMGQSAMTHCAFTAVGRWFVREPGRAISLTSMGLSVGQALLPLLYVALAQKLGWRQTWMWAAGFLLAMLPLLLALLKREPKNQSTPTAAAGTADKTPGITQRQWSRAEALRDPAFYVLILAIAPMAVIGSTILFHQVYFIEMRGWDLQQFTLGFSVMAVSTVLATFISGYLVDRFTALRLMPLYLLPLGLACFLLAFIPDIWVVQPFMILFGITNGFSFTLFGAIWPEAYGLKHLGAIRSVAVSVVISGTAIGPGIAGLLIDRGVPFPHLIAMSGVVCIVISGVMYFTAIKLRARQAAG